MSLKALPNRSACKDKRTEHPANVHAARQNRMRQRRSSACRWHRFHLHFVPPKTGSVVVVYPSCQRQHVGGRLFVVVFMFNFRINHVEHPGRLMKCSLFAPVLFVAVCVCVSVCSIFQKDVHRPCDVKPKWSAFSHFHVVCWWNTITSDWHTIFLDNIYLCAAQDSGKVNVAGLFSRIRFGRGRKRCAPHTAIYQNALLHNPFDCTQNGLDIVAGRSPHQRHIMLQMQHCEECEPVLGAWEYPNS